MRFRTKFIITFWSLLILTGLGLACFQVEEMTITGNQVYSDDEVKGILFQERLSGNSIYLYLKDKLVGFGAIPFVQEVELEWTSVNGVIVRIYEKSLVACFSYMGEHVYFDKDGIVLESSKTKIENIPLIEGIAFSRFALNKKITMERESTLKRILDLSQLIKHYDLDVEKVVFNAKNEVTFLCGGTKVYLGDREMFDEPIASLPSVLGKAREENLKGTIDLANFSYGDNIILKLSKR